MKISDGRISIMVGSDKTRIEIKDNAASVSFVRIEMTPAQLSQALSGLANTECSIKVVDLDKVGKRMEHKPFEFKVDDRDRYDIKKEQIIGICNGKCPEGWTPDTGFNSQNSFFNKNEEAWARTTIRRWV